MRVKTLCLIVFLSSFAGANARAAGFERLVVPGSPDINVGVWYPSVDMAPNEANTPFRQALALNGTPDGTGLPLIVVSHGNGGWMGGHAGTALALAEAGYVVAALEHAGNNSEDKSARPSEWAITRPAEISSLIDFMLEDWRHAARLAPEKIGVFGFSAGGYTALVAAGGRPDFQLGQRHCSNVPDEFVCHIGMVEDIAGGAAINTPSLAPDDRIAAISVAAPGFGFFFSKDSLASLNIPVQIWSGAIDKRVPHSSNGHVIAQNLPHGASVSVIENAGHFAFMAECNPQLEHVNPRIWAMVCVDAEGFDRRNFHKTFNASLVTFFDASLGR